MTTSESLDPVERARAYSQLLRQQERAIRHLHGIAEEMGAPMTHALLEKLETTGSGIEDLVGGIRQVLASIRLAIEAAETSQEAIHHELMDSGGEPVATGAPNLSPTLARFLAARKDSPGFGFEVTQDSVRGWILRWKEYGADGNVLGAGQFYERPYAWLDG